MGFVILAKDENGTPSYIDRVFPTDVEAFQFAKTIHLHEGQYIIISEGEFQAYLQSQQQSGYRQYVDVIDEQSEPESTPRQKRPVIRNFKPEFATFPYIRKNRRR